MTKLESNQRVMTLIEEALARVSSPVNVSLEKDADNNTLHVAYYDKDTRNRTVVPAGVALADIDPEPLEKWLDGKRVPYCELEPHKMYYVACRTYTEDGEYMNTEWNYVMVPERVYTSTEEKLLEFLTESVTEEMNDRCDEDDGEAYWELDEWGEEKKKDEK